VAPLFASELGVSLPVDLNFNVLLAKLINKPLFLTVLSKCDQVVLFSSIQLNIFFLSVPIIYM